MTGEAFQRAIPELGRAVKTELGRPDQDGRDLGPGRDGSIPDEPSSALSTKQGEAFQRAAADLAAIVQPEDSDVETLAELLSWTSGDMTRYSETANRNHNVWSWQGDDWGLEAVRAKFRRQARELLATGQVVFRK